MKKYTIEIDEATSRFFEDIAIIANRPVEKVLADGLFKQAELITLKIASYLDADRIR